jgi:hypothetical protein
LYIFIVYIDTYGIYSFMLLLPVVATLDARTSPDTEIFLLNPPLAMAISGNP